MDVNIVILILCLGNIFVGQEAIILSFKSTFFSFSLSFIANKDA